MTLIVLRVVCGLVAVFAGYRFIATGDGLCLALVFGMPLVGKLAE